MKKGGTIQFSGSNLYMNDSICEGSTGLIGAVFFIERSENFQNVIIENSRFFNNYGSYGGVLGVYENILNLEVFIRNNVFINNGAESKIVYYNF